MAHRHAYRLEIVIMQLDCMPYADEYSRPVQRIFRRLFDYLWSLIDEDTRASEHICGELYAYCDVRGFSGCCDFIDKFMYQYGPHTYSISDADFGA